MRTVPNHLTPAVHMDPATGEDAPTLPVRSLQIDSSAAIAKQAIARAAAAVIDLDTLPSAPQTPNDNPDAYDLLRQAAGGPVADAVTPTLAPRRVSLRLLHCEQSRCPERPASIGLQGFAIDSLIRHQYTRKYIS